MGERRGTKALEIWCRRVTDGYRGVSVDNMTTSWRDGLAFCALIHRFRPDLIEFDRLNPENALYNNDLAFTTAERHLGIPALLDAEDMVDCHSPDRLSVLTYVAQFYRAFGEASFAMGLISPGRNSPLKREHSEGSPSTPARTPEGEQPPKKSALPAGLARREMCATCGESVFLAERLRHSGRTFHRRCFRCARCGAQLSPANCYETESHAFCCEVCPDEERGDFTDEEEEAAAPAEAAPPDNHDDYSVSFESALEDDSPHPVTSAQDLAMISAHSSTTHHEASISGSGGGATAAPGGGFVNSRKSLFEALETAAEERNAAAKRDEEKLTALGGKGGSESNEEKETDKSEAETPLNDTLEEIGDKKEAEKAPEVDQISPSPEKEDFAAELLPESEPPPDLPKSEPPELPKTEPPELINKPEQTVSGFESLEAKTASPPLPSISIESVNNGTVCSPNSASTNDKASTFEEKSTSNEIDVTKEETTMEQPAAAPKIVVQQPENEEEEEVYPDDLNPFGDEEEEAKEEEKKTSPKKVVSLNPFGSESEEEEEEKERKPSPRRLIPVEPSLNPFWEDGEEEEEEPEIRKSVPVPRPRSLHTESPSKPSPAPRSSMVPSSSPYGSLHKKKKPPPPPPGTPSSSNVSPLPSPGGTMTKSRKTRRAPLPPQLTAAGSPGDKETKDEINRSKQNNSVAPEKSHQGQWKRKKRPAPGLPIPARRQILTLPMNEVRRELEMIEVQQRGLEKQGVTLESLIREQLEKTCEAEDEESLPVEVEEMVLQLMDLVMEKNELFRRQAELMYLKRQHRLEEQQAELEYQIRCLLQKSNKDEADLAREEELISRLVEVVEHRNEIVDCLEMDRKREADEDQSVRESRLQITERLTQGENDTPKTKGKKLKLKLLQKNKKSKEEKEKEKLAKEEKKRKKSNGEIKVSKEGNIEGESSSIKSKTLKKKWF